MVLSAWLHYALGNTLSQITEVLNFHLQIKVTPGGLVQMWYRLQAILFSWYEEIQKEALQSGVLHGDETGWRVRRPGDRTISEATVGRTGGHARRPTWLPIRPASGDTIADLPKSEAAHNSRFAKTILHHRKDT